jgi:hypothetical protein
VVQANENVESGPTEWTARAPVGVGPWQGPWPSDDRYDPDLLEHGDTRNVVDAYRYWRRSAIVSDVDRRRHPFHVAIENFQHDHNIGTVVRTANAFAAAAVHIVGRRRWNRRGAMVTDRYQHLHHHPDVVGIAEFARAEDDSLFVAQRFSDLPYTGEYRSPGQIEPELAAAVYENLEVGRQPVAVRTALEALGEVVAVGREELPDLVQRLERRRPGVEMLAPDVDGSAALVDSHVLDNDAARQLRVASRERQRVQAAHGVSDHHCGPGVERAHDVGRVVGEHLRRARRPMRAGAVRPRVKRHDAS